MDLDQSPALPDPVKPVPQSGFLPIICNSDASHTSFGRLPLSDEKSAPVAKFGTATRERATKMFIGAELSATFSIGQSSPGPIYFVQDKFDFSRAPKYSYGKEPRETKGSVTHYDFYDMRDLESDPVKSRLAIERDYGSTKFGTSGKAGKMGITESPGPQYYPPPPLHHASPPKYTIGARRQRGNLSFDAQTSSTPSLVGPGRYAPEKSMVMQGLNTSVKWSLPKKTRTTIEVSPTSTHQTYVSNIASCGPQLVSHKPTLPMYGFGSATRDQRKRLGLFPDMMSTQPVKVRLPLPPTLHSIPSSQL